MTSKINCSHAELLDIDSPKIVPHPKNMNNHPREQIDRLAKLIEFQGQRHPVIISKLSGFIVAGHGRFEAIKILRTKGWDYIAVDYQDFDNEAQEYAFMVSDNAIQEWAELDKAKINLEMLDLGPELDIELLGIEDFVIEPIEKFEPQTDEDDVPEVVHPITRRGDIWILGNHRLMCGDSTMIDDVDRLMSGEKADMVFTDPPYGVSYTKKTKDVLKSKNYTEIKNDEKSGEDLKDFFNDIFSTMVLFMKDTCSYYVCSPQGGDSEMMMMMMMRESGMRCRHQIIWDKEHPVFSMGRLDYDYQHEPILYGWIKKHEFFRNGSQDKSIWKFKRTENKLHPTMKPVELIENALKNSSIEKWFVMDLFSGSGSTIIACEKTNRKCYGMELDEHYCDVIINRWQNYTGKKATLELTGQTYEELKAEREVK